MKDRSGKSPRLGCKICKATGVALGPEQLCKRCRRPKKATPAPRDLSLCPAHNNAHPCELCDS